jgi:hypothetical protein
MLETQTTFWRMNPFTHTHIFQTPGFYMCSVTCHKLLSGRVLLQHNVEDRLQFAAGIRLL